MKRLCLWLVAIASLCVGFGSPANAIELINDRHFQSGYDVYASDNGPYEGLMQYTTVNGAPKWQLGQFSKQSIYGATPIALGGGTLKWENDYKTVVLGPTTTSHADMELGINSIAEFGGVFRKANQSWPGIVVSQEISTPSGWLGSAAPSVAQMTSANFNIDVNLTLAENNYGPGYNPNLHAAQFNQYFTLQNLNQSSSGFGDYIWFGICIYGDRSTVSSTNIMIDQGTGSLIYSLGLDEFGKTEGPQVGEWMNINGDLLPYLKDALQRAWAQGMLTDSTDYNDYYLGSEFLMWELPGLSDVNIQVKNLSLNATLVPEPSTLASLATGLIGLLAYAWRKRK